LRSQWNPSWSILCAIIKCANAILVPEPKSSALNLSALIPSAERVFHALVWLQPVKNFQSPPNEIGASARPTAILNKSLVAQTGTPSRSASLMRAAVSSAAADEMCRHRRRRYSGCRLRHDVLVMQPADVCRVERLAHRRTSPRRIRPLLCVLRCRQKRLLLPVGTERHGIQALGCAAATAETRHRLHELGELT
jgi:hypothetical protein